MEESLVVNGKLIPSSSGITSLIANPATGEEIARVPLADPSDVNLAVDAAHNAFQAHSWKGCSTRERVRLLLKLSELIRARTEELAILESKNVGKPIRESRDEVTLAADCFQYYGGVVDKVGGTTPPLAAKGVGMTFREPLGVCVLIVPWNFPIAIASWKLAPALAMGNTVVIKPASLTPLTALAVGRLALEAGFPPGVVNVLSGSGVAIGETLVRHPLVRKVSFTGSTQTGTEVMKWAADGMKRLTLELGGKSANIVFADADWEASLRSAVWSVLGNAGQDCCARSRLLVESTIFERFLSDLVDRFGRVRIGDPMNDETEMGSLVSVSHRERVASYIKKGLEEGANLHCGGDVPVGKEFESGAYLRPAVFADVKPSMVIAREEIFGPVVSVFPFRTEDEAIALANDSPYGLSGSVWSKDGARALRVARAMETGVVSVNSGSSVHLEAPFGGVKSSGFGRELGLAALDHYSEWKSVFFSTE